MLDENNLDIEMIDDNILVVHNALRDPEALIDYYEDYGDWKGWYGFGRQIDARAETFHSHPHFPTWEDWQNLLNNPEISNDERPYRIDVARAFHLATKAYMEKTGRDLPNWTSQAWGLARYIPDEDLINNPDLTMNYHTDFVADDAESPGDKFGITAVIYPNDDYEGGEISFRVISPEETVAKEVSYKPKAGDIVVFPSGHPYYHGVRRISGGPKYIIRLYWMYNFEGTEDWHNLKEKYGDEFEELERDRRNRHYLMNAEPFLRPRYCCLKEYYQWKEDGTLPEDGSQWN